GAARAEADGDVAGGEIDDGAGDEEGRDLAWTTGQHGRVFSLDDVEPADAGADMDSESVAVRLVDLEAGVVHGLLGGSDGKVDKAAHLAGLFFVNEDKRI